MRFVPKSSLYATSFVMLASLVGCSDPAPSGPTPDGGSNDASTDAQTPSDMTTPTDTPTTDTPAPTDTPIVVDAPPVDVPVGSCGVSGQVAAYVTESATMGWAALNRSHSIMMHGCAGATRPQDCLATVPLADDSNIGANRSAINGAHLRVLYTATTRSNYWTRSSADGRFVGRGTRVHDLVRDVEITASGAMYDPAFFPDNNGFMYQPGGRLCPQSALSTGMPTSIAIMGTGSPCSGSSVGLYEHLGASLSGEDYWASSAGTAAWDDGGHTATLQETRRNETWGANATTVLSLMANTGAGFSFVGNRNVATPFQGDAVISPSSRAMITRFVDESGVYGGYVLHRVNAAHTGAAIMVSTQEIARYCTLGAKPAFSYDERYVTYHHYLGAGPTADADAMDLGFTNAADSRFADYARSGAANIYVLDLLTGVRTRVTTMGPGQYALYPHFRSDGWIYFLVRTLGTPNETVVASDAALLMR